MCVQSKLPQATKHIQSLRKQPNLFLPLRKQRNTFLPLPPMSISHSLSHGLSSSLSHSLSYCLSHCLSPCLSHCLSSLAPSLPSLPSLPLSPYTFSVIAASHPLCPCTLSPHPPLSPSTTTAMNIVSQVQRALQRASACFRKHCGGGKVLPSVCVCVCVCARALMCEAEERSHDCQVHPQRRVMDIDS